MDDSRQPSRELPAALVALAICLPTVLGIYPVRLALIGMGFGPALWVATSWQLASILTWTIAAMTLLPGLRRRTDANVATGQPALLIRDDTLPVAFAMLMAMACHAATLATASSLLFLGRGRPGFATLVVDVLLLYAPMNVMTALGLVGAAIVAAESRVRSRERAVRRDLERQLHDARHDVLAALADLNRSTAAPATPPEPAAPLERIPVTIGTRTELVPVADIDWIEARSYYARLHVGDRSHLVRQSMNALEKKLDSRRFARIHRSTIVNLDRVAELLPFDRRAYVVVLRDGRRLMMSRRRRRLLDYLLP